MKNKGHLKRILTFENFNWTTGLFIVGYHLLLLIAVPLAFWHYTPALALLITSFAMVFVTGLSVTSAYHRLYSHLTYKTRPIVEGVLLFFATMATQGSALRWSFEHRIHHAFVDTDRDPYCIKKGFWYAHFLWLFEKPKDIDNKVIADLLRKPMLVFQHKYYATLMIITNVIATLFLGWCFNDYLGAFVFGWLARLFLLHHFTWFINSLAHTWGARPFCQELSAVDNYVICLLTFGEGYHNYHHTFAFDYRNGIRWYHFDPTKWLIWTLYKCGLASQLKRVNAFHIQEKIFEDRKKLILEKIQASPHLPKEEWENRVTTLVDNLRVKLKELKVLHEEYSHLRKTKQISKEVRISLKSQITRLRKSLKEEYRLCVEMTRFLSTQLTSTENITTQS